MLLYAAKAGQAINILCNILEFKFFKGGLIYLFDKLSFRHIVFGIVTFFLLGMGGDYLGEYNEKYKEILGMNMVYTPVFVSIVIVFETCYELIVDFLKDKDMK